MQFAGSTAAVAASQIFMLGIYGTEY